MELTFSTDSGETSYFARWAAAAWRYVDLHRGTCRSFARTGLSKARCSLTWELDTRKPICSGRRKKGTRQPLSPCELLRSCRLFHFHDTSDSSAARKPCYVEANRFLYPDAGNLAAMLYLFREKHPTAYRRITATVRQMVPDFDGFVLEPSKLNEKQILLNWTHKGRDYEFGPHQLSDGSLRFIALATLLLQPEEKLPLLIALDEPELGLHPSALEVLSGMAKAASLHSQLIFATQSSVFLDHFEPENIVVVNSSIGHIRISEARRRESWRSWRADYTLGEIWEKNVVGGGPYG